MVNSKLAQKKTAYLCHFSIISALFILSVFLQKILSENAVNLVFNKGISFGLFKENRLMIILVSIIIIIALFYLLISTIKKSNNYYSIDLIAYSLIIAGSLSNLYERINYGYVVDYFNLWFIPTFNLADSMIFIGVFLLILFLLFFDNKKN